MPGRKPTTTTKEEKHTERPDCRARGLRFKRETVTGGLLAFYRPCRDCFPDLDGDATVDDVLEELDGEEIVRVSGNSTTNSAIHRPSDQDDQDQEDDLDRGEGVIPDGGPGRDPARAGPPTGDVPLDPRHYGDPEEEATPDVDPREADQDVEPDGGSIRAVDEIERDVERLDELHDLSGDVGASVLDAVLAVERPAKVSVEIEVEEVDP